MLHDFLYFLLKFTKKMVTLKNKTAVDDYYSNISSSPEDNEKKKVSVKRKIKIKPKKVLIKKKVSEDDNISVSEPKIEKKKIIKKKNIISLEEPEKKEPIKTEVVINKVEKEIVDNKIIKATNETVVEKKEEKTKPKKKFLPIEVEEKKFTSKSTWKFKGKRYWEEEDEKAWKSKKFKLSPYRGKKHKFQEAETEATFVRSSKIKKKKKEEKKVEDIKQNLVSRSGETVIIWDILTLKEFSEKIWVVLPKLIAEFMKNGLMVNINSPIDFDTASLIAESFDIKLERDNSWWISVKDIMKWDIKDLFIEDDSSKLETRTPIISIMWHVDHWKTSLLDYIRKEKVAESEAWGITQSIWAYQVEHNDKLITFLDTPWHEAFTVMRARWAKSTDIAILVVAATEWVKPQTIESINHAKEADIPIIVAINKMDKQWANPDHVKSQLSENGLIPEDWGWDTPMVPVSAMTWFWIEELLEIITLVADMKELKANPNRAWVATIIESHLDPSIWPVATAIVNTWTVQKWDNIVCKDSFWKIKILKDYSLKWVSKVLPWAPALIVWLDKVVEGWDLLQVVSSPVIAKNKAVECKEIMESKKKLSASWIDMLMSRIKAWNLKQLKIVLKADTNWSLEAIKNALIKLSTPETNVSIIHSWVWNITEWDVLMCEWSTAILIWFNTSVVPTAKKLIEDTKIEYISSNIIYHITERIEKIVTWMLDTKEVEVVLARAKVLQIFYTSKKFMVLWVKIEDWEKIEPDTKVRVIRKDKMVWKWEVTSLKLWVEDVKLVEWPAECGIKFSWDVVVEEKDIVEIYKIEIQK